MSRAHNFCAGPAALPLAVLERAQRELLDWSYSGASVMEVSHRSSEFVSVADRAESSLRRLLEISDDYAVLFLQGGASLQFASVPLNLAAKDQVMDQVVTGQWSKKAFAEQQRFGDVNLVASSADQNFASIPQQDSWQRDPTAAYLHYCPNETIGGLEFGFVPDSDVPLVADMSSTILSRPVDVDRFGVIYAGAQKNIGPAGLCLVIVRRELLGRARPETPAMLNWQIAAENDSMYNTPPTFAIYLAGLVFEWLEELGGLEKMEAINRRKAEKLYALIDESGFYANPVEQISRSLMNVPFTLADDALDTVFLKEAEARQLLNLKGHRSVGGMRASLYNAVEESSVDALCSFMRDFEQRHG
ncbi:MAG: 3-phosphoserine/phosphohydroxythreonine aminotransferase [Halieaceae bacterium]|mgnify:FL=1|nr:3-phosphoserine/phosphohydroxythreonine aminotransferase [Halieaceae bacterium]